MTILANRKAVLKSLTSVKVAENSFQQLDFFHLSADSHSLRLCIGRVGRLPPATRQISKTSFSLLKLTTSSQLFEIWQTLIKE